jgi:hypothetical protein
MMRLLIVQTLSFRVLRAVGLQSLGKQSIVIRFRGSDSNEDGQPIRDIGSYVAIQLHVITLPRA